jgi:1-deoxy-D-xylulose-5-phosphate reductoisomerase
LKVTWGSLANKKTLIIDLLEKQAREFKPEAISITEPQLAKELASRLDGQNIRVFSGNEGLNRIATLKDIDMVLNSIVGVAGLIPTFEAIKHKKNIALANNPCKKSSILKSSCEYNK